MLWLKIEGGVRMEEGKGDIAVFPFFFESFQAGRWISDLVQFLTTHFVNTTQPALVVLRQGVSKWVLVKGPRRA